MVSSPPPIEPEGIFDGLRWSLILRGAVLDIFLTTFALFPIMLFVAGGEAISENEQAAKQAINQAATASDFLILSFIAGISITAYAGYWASRRAGASHLRHGGWTAVASAALSSFLLLLPGSSAGPAPPVWYDALALALMVPAGVFGGWVASKTARPS
jgi:uncharacterized protein YqgC (DUF456 family)